jgi:hypothetical protein
MLSIGNRVVYLFNFLSIVFDLLLKVFKLAFSVTSIYLLDFILTNQLYFLLPLIRYLPTNRLYLLCQLPQSQFYM